MSHEENRALKGRSQTLLCHLLFGFSNKNNTLFLLCRLRFFFCAHQSIINQCINVMSRPDGRCSNEQRSVLRLYLDPERSVT